MATRKRIPPVLTAEEIAWLAAYQAAYPTVAAAHNGEKLTSEAISHLVAERANAGVVDFLVRFPR